MPPKGNSETKILIKETIKELLADEDFINNVLKRVSVKVAELEKVVQKQGEQIYQLNEKLDNIYQNEKANNVCLYGMEEEDNEKIYTKVLSLFNTKMEVAIKREDLVKCYRIGAANNQRPRPIIVKFESYNLKSGILRNCKKLKGTRIGIVEELSKSKLNLLKMAKEKTEDKRRICTRRGNVYLKMNDGKLQKITKIDDIDRF